MKFQKLIIHNIASIEDATIDFEAQPLASSEVFLITGKTGAGKSTILDAICLALYADTPRMDSTKMQGKTADGEKAIDISDPRQLMRRNTGEAFSTLTFLGSNGVHYEATWAVQRARKKVTGNLQPKSRQLTNLDTGHTLTKDKEIEAELKGAIGLDFNQFCRTTMLAQGEFTRFLNSKDEEKADILEKITGVDIYSKIGAKVFDVTCQKKQLWEDALQHIKGIRLLSDEEITQKKEVLSQLDFQHKELKAKSDTLTTKYNWIKKFHELNQQLSNAAKAHHVAIEATTNEEFKQKAHKVSTWKATIDARRLFEEMQKAERTKNEQLAKLNNLSKDFATLQGAQLQAKQIIIQIDNECNTIEDFLQKEAERATVYENAQTIANNLSTIDIGRIAIQKNKIDIEKTEQRLQKELIPILNKAKQEAKAAKDHSQETEQNIKNCEEAMTDIRLPQLREQQDKTQELLRKIATAKDRIDILETAKKQHERNREKLTKQLLSVNNKKEALSKTISLVHDAQLKMNIRKEVLEKQSDTVNKFASTLRLKMKVGDTCPVCCQKITQALPHEDELSALFMSFKKDYETAEQEYKTVSDRQISLQAAIESEWAIYKRDKSVFDNDQSVSFACQKAQEACEACGIKTLHATVSLVLDTMDTKVQAKSNALCTRIKEGETKENQLKLLRKALDTQRKEIDNAKEKVTKAEKSINECKMNIAALEATVKTKETDIHTAAEKVSNLVCSHQWDINWNHQPAAFAQALTAAAKNYNIQLQQQQKLSAKLATAKAIYKNTDEIIKAILQAMPTWKQIEPVQNKTIASIQSYANTLNTAVATIQGLIRTAQRTYNSDKTLLADYLNTHQQVTIGMLQKLCAYTNNDIDSIEALLKKKHDAVIVANTLLANAQKVLAEHQQTKPQIADDDTLSTLTLQITDLEKQLNEITERKGAIHQELKTDQDNKLKQNTLIEDAGKKKIIYQKWSRLNQLIGDATGKRFRTIAQSYVLASLIHSANNYLTTLTNRYTLKVIPGTFVITLEDAYQGFVARAASTLSGGESFLVSLSLALALSDIDQKLCVDTLFIDEGFGTLSGEPLQNAINTLRSLHTKAGRHVGIISHVEELRERIPVQIQVNQEGNNSSSKVEIVSDISFSSPQK